MTTDTRDDRIDAAWMKLFVKGLPSKDRHVLMLHYAEQLPPRDIAAILEMSVSQVESRLAALRACARAALESRHLGLAG